METSTTLVTVVAIISGISLAVIAGGSLYLSVLTFLKNRSKVEAIYLGIFPPGAIGTPIVPNAYDIEITISNIGQRIDSVISVSIYLDDGGTMPISIESFPLMLNERMPKKIRFQLLEVEVFRIVKIQLTTGAKKKIEVNQKWIKGQFRLSRN